MRRLKLAVLLTCFLLSSGQAVAASSLAEFAAWLDAHMPQLLETHGVPGASIALIEDGGPVWSRAYGMADVTGARPMRIDSLYRVESISKSLTAWGVMKLVEQGRIDLDAPVERYLGGWTIPATAFDASLITVRSLLTHTSGLPLGSFGAEYTPGAPMPSLRDFLSAEVRPVRPAGEIFDYSNVGFDLLELAIETVTGERFADYMQREMLLPLRMTHSGFGWTADADTAMATGYDLDGNSVAPYVYPALASGGLLATVDDIARFVAAGANGQDVLSPVSLRQIQEPSTSIPGAFGLVADAYGFGHFIDRPADGAAIIWSGGQGHGWMSDFHIVQENGDGIVILTNSQRSWPLFADLLIAWSDWTGVPRPGMTRIAAANNLAWGVIAVIALAAAIQSLRLVSGLITGAREFSPLSSCGRLVRGTQALVGLALLGCLVWATRQDYLFTSSVLPAATSWLGLVLAGLATVLLASSLLPLHHGSSTSQGRPQKTSQLVS